MAVPFGQHEGRLVDVLDEEEIEAIADLNGVHRRAAETADLPHAEEGRDLVADPEREPQQGLRMGHEGVPGIQRRDRTRQPHALAVEVVQPRDRREHADIASRHTDHEVSLTDMHLRGKLRKTPGADLCFIRLELAQRGTKCKFTVLARVSAFAGQTFAPPCIGKNLLRRSSDWLPPVHSSPRTAISRTT